MLQLMGLQRVRCDLATEQQQFSNWILKALILLDSVGEGEGGMF